VCCWFSSNGLPYFESVCAAAQELDVEIRRVKPFLLVFRTKNESTEKYPSPPPPPHSYLKEFKLQACRDLRIRSILVKQSAQE